jgi:hypothetical protein
MGNFTDYGFLKLSVLIGYAKEGEATVPFYTIVQL